GDGICSDHGRPGPGPCLPSVGRESKRGKGDCCNFWRSGRSVSLLAQPGTADLLVSSFFSGSCGQSTQPEDRSRLSVLAGKQPSLQDPSGVCGRYLSDFRYCDR